MKLIETKIEGDTIYDGKILRLERDKVILENGNTAYREVVRHNGGACIVPVTKDKEILFVKQYRYPFSKVIIELPAGKLELNEQPEVCAKRELREETGAIGEVEYLTEIYPTPGYSSEIIYIYAAFNVEIGNLSLDEDEFIDVVKVDINSALEMIKSGEIKDAKTIVGILLVADRIKGTNK